MHFSKNKISVILLLFPAVFIVYYTVMQMLGPYNKLRIIEEDYNIRRNERTGQETEIFRDSAYLSLLREKYFLQSRIKMAESDSVSLTLDFPDSIAALEINGVTVHRAKITRLKISRLLTGNEPGVLSLYSGPFNITDNYSSIKKEPLMIKMAPKDTSEFVPDIIPDTTDLKPVNFILSTDNGTRLYVFQDKKEGRGDGIRLFFFDLKFRIKDMLGSLKSVIMFEIPEYHPSVRIWIPRSDARIIYRALPEYGQFSIFR